MSEDKFVGNIDIEEFEQEGAQRFWRILADEVKENNNGYDEVRSKLKRVLADRGKDADEAFFALVGSDTISGFFDREDNRPIYQSKEISYNSFIDLFDYCADKLDPDDALDALFEVYNDTYGTSVPIQISLDCILEALIDRNFESLLKEAL